MALARARLEDGPAPGDLVVETSWIHRPDPDAIGWLVGYGQAPYGRDDPTDGSVPMREVWDVRPLSDAKGLEGNDVQRWENARFMKVPEHVVRRLGLTFPSRPAQRKT